MLQLMLSIRVLDVTQNEPLGRDLNAAHLGTDMENECNEHAEHIATNAH